MASLFGSLKGLVHDTAAALVDQQITTKLSGTVTSFVDSGFGIIDDTLKIVRDLTVKSTTPPVPPAPGP
jgi:hypothetical protein